MLPPIALKTKNIAHVAWTCEAAEASIKQTLKGAEAATGHADQIKDGEKEREREGGKERKGARGSERGNRSFKTEGSLMTGARQMQGRTDNLRKVHGWLSHSTQGAVVRQERPAKRLWRACFHILLREQCVGDIDIYGLREGGGTFCFWITFLFFTPSFHPVAFFPLLSRLVHSHRGTFTYFRGTLLHATNPG